MYIQEHLHFVTEICQDEVFILDHEAPAVSQVRAPGMPDVVVEPSSRCESPITYFSVLSFRFYTTLLCAVAGTKLTFNFFALVSLLQCSPDLR